MLCNVGFAAAGARTELRGVWGARFRLVNCVLLSDTFDFVFESSMNRVQYNEIDAGNDEKEAEQGTNAHVLFHGTC